MSQEPEEQEVSLEEVIAEVGSVGTEGNKDGTTILKKLHAIQKCVNGLKKDKASHSYQYTTGDKVLAHIKPLMNHYGVLLEMHVTDIENNQVAYKTGFGTNIKDKLEMYTAIKTEMVWVCIDTAEERRVKWGANGMNDWEKGFGSALTYGERYFFLKYFHIATDQDDIDNPDRKPLIEEPRGTGAGATADRPKTPTQQQPPAVGTKKTTANKTTTAAKATPKKDDSPPVTTPPPAEEKKEDAKTDTPKTDVKPPVDDTTRKEAAKKAFSREDQKNVLLYLIKNLQIKEKTIDEWIDATPVGTPTDVGTVLYVYTAYKASLPK